MTRSGVEELELLSKMHPTLPQLGLRPQTPSPDLSRGLTLPPYFDTIANSHKNKKVG